MKIYLIMCFMFLVQTTVDAKEYKAVFDCSSSDMRYVASRMAVVEETARLIELRGDTVKIALTLHGGCVPIATESVVDADTSSDNKIIQKARDSISRLYRNYNAEIVVCAMSLDANGIEKGDIIPFIRIAEDSFIDTIGYQNDGYALMSFP